MDWEKLLLPKRFFVETSSLKQETGRSHFHKDFDRIVFSSAFRRLGKKTQVHPLASNDHIHNRLTHSIEVSSVGRSLGIIVAERISDKLPEHITTSNVGEIVQAACLAHDIGNPPFGHAGEDAIRSWFSQPEVSANYLALLNENEKDDFLNFEGNAQSFRIVTKLEHNTNEGGIRLTYPTLATMLKYPWTTREIKKNKKFSCFQSEAAILEKVADTVGLIKKDESLYCRHPLSFLAEAADDICYRVLDLEDAHEMKVLGFEEILGILKPLCEQEKDFNKIIKSETLSPRRKISYLRGKSIGKAIDTVADAFIDNYETIMSGSFANDKDLIDLCNEDIREPLAKAKETAKQKVFNQPRKIELEIGSYTSLGILLDVFCKAAKEKIQNAENLSFRSSRILSMMGINAPKNGEDLYSSLLRVTDYISGMTDSYATHMAKQVGGMAL
jgi:dGTPase